MVKLLLDDTPSDFKTTKVEFRKNYYFKASSLRYCQVNFEKIGDIIHNIFSKLEDVEQFNFRKDLTIDCIDIDIGHKEFINISSILEYITLYVLLISDKIDIRKFKKDPNYLKDSTSWFTSIHADKTVINTLKKSARTEDVLTIDLSIKPDIKKVVEHILNNHLCDSFNFSTFTTVDIKEFIKLIWL